MGHLLAGTPETDLFMEETYEEKKIMDSGCNCLDTYFNLGFVLLSGQAGGTK